ncbi:MAG: hypothetical protein U5O69_08615 [Candidatus Competibacteraceae bacterium]|nr:hypothetical protein [Candidatus Competibacteraceae bacterium]
MQTGIRRTALALALLSPLAIGTAFSQEKAPAPAAATAPAPVMEQGALDLVKKMSAKLASTPAFLVRTRSSLEAPGGTGQFLTSPPTGRHAPTTHAPPKRQPTPPHPEKPKRGRGQRHPHTGRATGPNPTLTLAGLFTRSP